MDRWIGASPHLHTCIHIFLFFLFFLLSSSSSHIYLPIVCRGSSPAYGTLIQFLAPPKLSCQAKYGMKAIPPGLIPAKSPHLRKALIGNWGFWRGLGPEGWPSSHSLPSPQLSGLRLNTAFRALNTQGLGLRLNGVGSCEGRHFEATAFSLLATASKKSRGLTDKAEASMTEQSRGLTDKAKQRAH